MTQFTHTLSISLSWQLSSSTTKNTQNYQQALDEFHEKNPDWGKGVYATVSSKQ
jgi:hypothetical protein